MKRVSDVNDPFVVQILLAGGVVVLRTDTLYGILAVAGNQGAVQRVYEIKGRTDTKSPIVLIADSGDMFDEYDTSVLETLKDLWPGPRSIILPATTAPSWITRGNGSVAYRVPNRDDLRHLLTQTGPLIAPSAITYKRPSVWHFHHFGKPVPRG